MLHTFLSAIKSFSPKEFTIFLVCSALVLLTGVLLIIQLINTYTVSVPAQGGTFTEGVVGQVAYLNPVLAREGSADRDAVALLFASVYDLAELIEHDEEFRSWSLRLKEEAVWHDNTPVTSDDIVFTVQIIQNTDAASPHFSNWQNVSVERVSEREVLFETVNTYALFENLLHDLRPIPKKYFADLSPANIRLSAFNLKPIGSGPFVFEELEKRADGFITSIFMKKNERYHAIGTLPHLDRFVMLYFENEDLLMRSFNKGLIDGFGSFTPRIAEYAEINTQQNNISTSRYYAVFLNQNAHSALASPAVRRALWLFVDREALIQDVFAGHAVVQQGPLPAYQDTALQNPVPAQGNTDEAHRLLEDNGWFFDDETRTWNTVTDDETLAQLMFTIKIPDSPIVRQIAESVRNQWETVGIKTKIETTDANLFSEDVLKTRNYEMIIYGNILLPMPDLTSFWHSNERFYPGLNFSLYESGTIDELLLQLRSIDPQSQSRNETLAILAQEIVSQTPALFIASPQYIYLTQAHTIGAPIDTIATPDARFVRITEWYAKTKRVSR
ncbi:hypothetical protein A2755_03585 [Candidatus Wolfebacteria bacterium RIFCSPHIGHO2_01_FULL_48_22]|uniref:Solute-binding protein family 5 domain-containing protein n=2 Tax=Candidatus Wolfeibacteriota TaxID=1752735 RepID=A0A1F8DPQ4_9BACT|nr:MAG: hypothetical protein A2755_03585 [Candidatus Wolfebacteria bacterium RIFCSPHIGHO2_01_FULL_48_22]OGM92108.1 MAG: hypothetical protein A2935_02075 [Candidatus Wolfebacteria bacterium RIFCSPLOWO2_01_FULL_47_17b]